eukprot:1160614-Pelagomonas_calceolata.AAC.8
MGIRRSATQVIILGAEFRKYVPYTCARMYAYKLIRLDTGHSGHAGADSSHQEDPCRGGQLYRLCRQQGLLPLHHGFLHAGSSTGRTNMGGQK